MLVVGDPFVKKRFAKIFIHAYPTLVTNFIFIKTKEKRKAANRTTPNQGAEDPEEEDYETATSNRDEDEDESAEGYDSPLNLSPQFFYSGLLVDLVSDVNLLRVLICEFYKVLAPHFKMEMDAWNKGWELRDRDVVIMYRLYWSICFDLRSTLSIPQNCAFLFNSFLHKLSNSPTFNSNSTSTSTSSSSSSSSSTNSNLLNLKYEKENKPEEKSKMSEWEIYIEIIRLTQGIDKNTKKLDQHVEYESKRCNHAYYLSFELHNQMLSLENSIPEISTKEETNSNESLNNNGKLGLKDYSILLKYILKSIIENDYHKSIDQEQFKQFTIQDYAHYITRSSQSSLIQSEYEFLPYDITVSPVSVHLPLHRLFTRILISVSKFFNCSFEDVFIHKSSGRKELAKN